MRAAATPGEVDATPSSSYVLDADDVRDYQPHGAGNAHCVFAYGSHGSRPELRRSLLRTRRSTRTDGRDDAWRCHPLDAAIWGVDRALADWVTLDARAREAFFARAGAEGAPGRWRDDVGIVELTPEGATALAERDRLECSRTMEAGSEGMWEKKLFGARRSSAAETRAQLSELATATSDYLNTARVDHLEDQKRLPGLMNVGSIEIKPKSFVGAVREGVGRVWRFPAHQTLKARDGRATELSEYAPIDLLGDEEAVRRACDALIRCPQNNMKETLHTIKDERHKLMLRDALPKVIEDARDVFSFIFSHQVNGGDDDPMTFRVVEAVVSDLTLRMERGNVDLESLEWTRILDLLRRFVLGQMAKDCSVLFTLNPDVGGGDDDDGPKRDRNPAVRFVKYRTVDDGVSRTCAYRVQVIDASLKSFAKAASWRARAEAIGPCVPFVDADVTTRAFVDDLFRDLDPSSFRSRLLTALDASAVREPAPAPLSRRHT